VTSSLPWGQFTQSLENIIDSATFSLLQRIGFIVFTNAQFL